METQRLRQLCLVVETGGLREAARLLGISHSGLSKSIKALEDELGVALFAPSGRGVVVTDTGRRVYEAARRVLAQTDDLASVARGEAPAARPLRIATFEVFSTYFAGELVARAFGDRPIALRERVPGAIEEALADDAADVGITYVPMPRVEIDYLKVTSMEMGIFGRPDFASVPIAKLPFCAPAIPLTGVATAMRGLDGWPDERVPRTVRYALDMLESALDLARRGLGVLYAPAFVVALHNRTVNARHALHALPLPKGIDASVRRRDVFVVKRRSTEESADIKKIARALREVCSLAPSP
ncbi:MAG: LysR family transcriptional regulator [Labilithrix sp.]|nr:LysR family transcriptional regulator [Labilithrix sp.]MCW5815843.1 LysR family transcriptional regulator [Labilithrix sp.]